jgi:hypothetical protein
MAKAKKALLVGINDYAPVGPGGPDLRGCVNDVRDMAHTLNALDIVPATSRSMQILTNERATKRAIMEKFTWLLSGASAGDLLIFYYSGHGTQVPDVNGDEGDGIDEAICPHDVSLDNLIRDDDFRAALANLPQGTNLDILLDSCFSGTGTRNFSLFEPPEEKKVAYRYYEPPVDWSYFIDANPHVPRRRLVKTSVEKGSKDAVIVPGLNHVLWAACRNNQTSAESQIDGSWRGAFTYYYCKALRRAGKTVTRRRLDSLVSADIQRAGFAQVPQLEGTAVSLGEKVFT